ncbi:2,4-dienoyl-CoA reductase-like NADH-dependent reductase (Old Yellow Enzyme family)/arginase family enzyme [Pseudomonas synxantha]|nr:2,4-dienoyl-CoA reductase-like NADH-dependent reductase (Old Yellow Enzyme family)/arginase family enzyme [Pseudomonas synxantha]
MSQSNIAEQVIPRVLTAAQLGGLKLKNHLAVAPMTRVTATEHGKITAAMHEYYLRFAQGGFGLVITEGLYTDKHYSQGYAFQPGLADDEQAQAWAATVQAVQAGGSRFFAQIMHSGALSQSNRFCTETVAPSAIKPKGQQLSFYYGKGDYAEPTELSEQQIAEIVEGFVSSAVRAVRISGFNGVEIHGANGYLLDQFLSYETNKRTDRWGGTTHGRVSLLAEIVEKVKKEIGQSAQVGIRISQGKVNDFTSKWPGGKADAQIIFSALAQAGADFIHVTEYDASKPAFPDGQDTLVSLAHRYAPGVSIIANGGLEDLESASKVLDAGASVLTIGKGALANPDLPNRLEAQLEMRPFNGDVLQPIANIKQSELTIELAGSRKTLRLKIPQWQGGDNPPTGFGAELLAFLAPASASPLVEIPVRPYTGQKTVIHDGVAHREAIMEQLQATTEVLNEHRPDRVVVFGGDCLVDQAPFAYLNERYEGQLAILWVDAHPDIKNPNEYCNAHTMVLANLLGEGDAKLAAQVKVHIDPKKVMFAGLRQDGLTRQEAEFIERHSLSVATPDALISSSESVLEWIRVNDVKHLAIHFDLDVLDPTEFRSVFFGEPNPASDPYAAFPAGKMSVAQVLRLINDVSRATDVVGLGITEHLPWDAITLKDMLAEIPILS